MGFDLGIAAGGAAEGLGQGTLMSMGIQRAIRENERHGIEMEGARLNLERAKREEGDDLAIRDAMKRAAGDAPKAEGISLAGATDDGGATPQAIAASVTKPKFGSEQERLLAMADAGWQTAAARGNSRLGMQHFAAANQLREQLLAKQLDTADRVAIATNGQDLSGYVEAYNRYIPDGMNVRGFQRQQDGSVRVAFERDGQVTEQVIPKDGVQQYLMQLRDPAFVRKMLAERANELFKITAKAKADIELERAKGEEARKTSAAEGKGIQVVTPRNEDGAEGVVLVDKGKGTITPAGGGIAPGSGGPSRRERNDTDARVKTAETHVLRYLGANDFTGLDAKGQETFTAAVARAGKLIRQQRMDPEQAANQAVLEAKDGRLSPSGEMKGSSAAPAPGGNQAPSKDGLPKLW